MITVCDLFPLWKTACKWLRVFRNITPQEEVRLEKEFHVHILRRGIYAVIEEWLIDDMYHRTDGPAEIFYSKNGNVECQSWYVYNKLHRVDGPARIYYHDNGIAWFHQWWIDGKNNKNY